MKPECQSIVCNGTFNITYLSPQQPPTVVQIGQAEPQIEGGIFTEVSVWAIEGQAYECLVVGPVPQSRFQL